jgi:hypothetical protein
MRERQDEDYCWCGFSSSKWSRYWPVRFIRPRRRLVGRMVAPKQSAQLKLSEVTFMYHLNISG